MCVLCYTNTAGTTVLTTEPAIWHSVGAQFVDTRVVAKSFEPTDAEWNRVTLSHSRDVS
jgi:hypothetical protein